ncbi:MAG TPA: hypothetical protein PLX27_03855, partial [Methanolinea sp.]|nr:hypothetical protein [Methanolinea sp.]
EKYAHFAVRFVAGDHRCAFQISANLCRFQIEAFIDIFSQNWQKYAFDIKKGARKVGGSEGKI